MNENDLNVKQGEDGCKGVEIACAFSDLPETIAIGGSNGTSLNLKQSYMLNSDGLLEVVKKYNMTSDSPKATVYINALHPGNPNCSGLLSKTQGELRTILDQFNISCNDRRKCSSMRSAIWGHFSNDLGLQQGLIDMPRDTEIGEANREYLFTAVKDLARCLKSPTVVATKSAVPVGTGNRVGKLIRRTNPTAQTEGIALPEFLREGYAMHDFSHPARIVVGTENAAARALIRERIARKVLETVKNIPHPRITAWGLVFERGIKKMEGQAVRLRESYRRRWGMQEHWNALRVRRENWDWRKVCGRCCLRWLFVMPTVLRRFRMSVNCGMPWRPYRSILREGGAA